MTDTHLCLPRRLMLAAVLTLVSFPCRAQGWDSASSREVAPGVVHRRLVSNQGPWRINVLEIDLTRPGLRVQPVRANDSALSRETVTSMFGRYRGPGRAVAAINGDFFNVRTGESENNVVIDGRIDKGITVTESPYDSFDNVHHQLGLDSRNRPRIERFRLDASMKAPGLEPMRLYGINSWTDSGTIALYTRANGDSTPHDSTGRKPTLVPLILEQRKGNSMIYKVAGNAVEGTRLPLAGGGALVGAGDMRELLRSIGRRGGAVSVTARIEPCMCDLRTVIGGWPRVVTNGRSVAEYSGIVEGTFDRFAGRNPRSAAGFSKDSSTLYLLTVDGRRPTDAGMTLSELAELMLKLGVHNGMNFDGGGSTTMVVAGTVVNRPSDAAGERAVGSGLLVITGADR